MLSTILTTNVPGRGLGLNVAPSLPCIASSKIKVFCPCRLASAAPASTVVARASSEDYPSSDDNSNLPSSSSSSPVPDTLPVAGVDTDWRAFRARLVASSSGQATNTDNTSLVSFSSWDDPWAHNITTLEPGCLLLASPEYFTHNQTYFNQAVILIAEHSPSQGSYGFIINKPTEHRISQVNSTGILPEQLNPCTLYLGGDVHKDNVSILHSVSGLKNTKEIVTGVYLGGIHDLGDKIGCGEVSPPEVKIMVGMAGWGPGQLQEEVARGVWIVASASKHVILSASVAGAGEELWHMTMQLMGGDYNALSEAVKETYRADIMEFKGGKNYGSSSVNASKKKNQSTPPTPSSSMKSENESEEGEEPRGGGGEPSSPTKGPWKPPRRDPGHNYGSGI